MSQYTRLASTDEQEAAIVTIEKAFKKAGTVIVGFTTIGKSPQTVILDIFHHGGNISINSNGVIEISEQDLGGDTEYDSSMVDEIADAIKRISAKRKAKWVS